MPVRSLALIVLVVALVAPAFARDWHIARFYTHMTVAQDGVDQRHRAPGRGL